MTTCPTSPVIWLAENGLKVVETRDQAGLSHTLLKCRKAGVVKTKNSL